MITVAEARARGISLPADSDAAEDIVAEQEAWLARRIGPLDGSRTETFYVGLGVTHGKLALGRYTDAVALTDGTLVGGAAVLAANFRLIDRGSAVHHSYSALNQWWSGPYVTATYEPNDEDEVRRVLFDLVALASQPTGALESETMGSYSYKRATGTAGVAASRAALATSLLPKRDGSFSIRAARGLLPSDPVINRAEPPDLVWQ